MVWQSPDGRTIRGVWEITPGVVADTEEDEVFVVVRGRATVEVEGGETFELAPGTLGVLERGQRTTLDRARDPAQGLRHHAALMSGDWHLRALAEAAAEALLARAATPRRARPLLVGDEEADLLVVGAG